jgi:hypothetical protein
MIDIENGFRLEKVSIVPGNQRASPGIDGSVFVHSSCVFTPFSCNTLRFASRKRHEMLGMNRFIYHLS